jgi:hypothetical protein
MFGCVSSAATFASSANIRLKASWFTYSGSTRFTTHGLENPSGPSMEARKMWAIPPDASCWTILYLPK